MEIVSSKSTTLLLFILLLLLTTTSLATAELSSQTLDAALFALRSNGYTLFPNAITTSDLHHLLLSSRNSSSSFTLFAPPDSLLFSLDLLSSARLFTTSLLLHVSPRLLSTSDLFVLPRPHLETLLPNHQLLVEQTLVSHNGNIFPLITVDGVRISAPDLFIGSNIAVHGLDGILVARNGDMAIDHGSAGPPAPALAPEQSLYKSCISPAKPPESWPPMANIIPAMLNANSGIKKDGGSDYDDHDGGGSNNKRARNGNSSCLNTFSLGEFAFSFLFLFLLGI